MLKNLAKKNIAPLLKKHGFKKKDLTWNKAVDGFIQVIDFQMSRFSSAEEDNFTINLGVFDSQTWQTCWLKEPPRFIKEEDCFPRIRVAQLLQEFSEEATDHWWICNAETDEESLGQEIADLLEAKCIPFLDSLLNHQSIIDFYSSNPVNLMPVEKMYLAIIKNSAGDVGSSSELLSEVSSISKAWSNRVEQVKSQLG